MQIVIHAILLVVLFTIVTRIKCDMVSRRLMLFYLLFWAFAILVSNNSELYPVSDYSFVLIYLHIVFFIIGFYSIRFIGPSSLNFQIRSVAEGVERLTKNPIFIIAFVFALLYVVYLFTKFYSLIILYQSLADVREDFFDADTNLYGPYFGLLNTILLVPLFYTLIPVFAYKCVFKRDIQTFFYGIFLLVYASLGGGRFDYIRIAIGFLFILFCVFNNYIQKRTKLLLVAVGGILMISFMVFITMGRTGVFSTEREDIDEGIEMTTKQVASYSGGSIVAFDYSINNDYMRRIDGPRYGRLTLAAIDMPLCVILRKIGFPANDAIGDLTRIKQNEIIQIGPEIRHNALYTSLLFYYHDLGLLGCLLFPFLFGFLSRRIIILFYKRHNLASFVLVHIVFLCFFYSIYDFALANVALFLFSTILLFIKR